MTTLRKVLVVDDDPVVGKSFNRVLSKQGYAVVTAASGEEALRKIAAEDYDAVYTDIRMPGMDGIEVAERIKGRRPWLPVVIVTGFGTQENEARAKAAGVNAVLHKPLSPAMIEESAREVMAQTHMPPMPALPNRAALLEPTPAIAEEQAATGSVLKALGMAFAAPVLGLAYVVAMPFVGLGMLAKYGAEAGWKKRVAIGTFVKNVALFLAAPFVGLLYIALFPVIGAAMLAWTGLKAVGVTGAGVKLGLKTTGMVIAAPVMGLAYTVALPVVALGLLCWMGGKALFGNRDE